MQANRQARIVVQDIHRGHPASNFVTMPQQFLRTLSFAAALCFAGFDQANAAPAAACSGGEVQQSFSFAAAGWPDGTLTKSFTVGAAPNQITLTFTSSNAGGRAFDAGFPGGQTTTSGNLVNTVRHSHSTAPANSYLSTFALTANRPLNKLKYVVTDVDFSTGNWQDQIVVSANNGASVFPTSMVGGVRHTINAATGTATATTNFNCAATDASCNVTVNYNLNNITSSLSDFRTGPSVATASAQNIGWNSFEWCLPPSANLSITKTNGQTGVQAGSAVSYTVVVSNAGPNAANNAIFADPAVANLTVSGVTCGSIAGGAACPTAGNTTVALMQGAGIVIPTLPSSGSVTFTVTGTTGTSGTIVNTATIAPPSGTVDPSTANNSATDTDTILLPSLLFMKTVTVTSDPVNGTTSQKFIPGADVLYTLRVTNTGPGIVTNNSVSIIDPVPANTELFTGNLSGGAPYLFVDGSPSSSLACGFTALNNATDCVDFSNNNGSTWTYVPNGSYDPAVTHLRFRPTGTMSGDPTAGSPSPSFDLGFRVRLK